MTSFVAVTYNVLAPSYLYPDRYPRCEPAAIDPVRRHRLLQERIAGLDADLICLQELEPSVHEGLSTVLGPGYASAYLGRPGRPDGLAVFARASVLDWIGHHQLSVGPSARDVALVVDLSCAGRPMSVVCGHLPWMPDLTPRADHPAYRQMLEVLTHRDATAPDSIWLLAGDFNAEPDSCVIQAALSRDMADSCRDQRPADTFAVDGRARRIDYLLYSTGRLVPEPDALPPLAGTDGRSASSRAGPNGRSASSRAGDVVLPSLTEPSDHLPLRVRFATTEERHPPA
jgi:endonuclease/exonuclease/phosphatase family metal-dependent hydrolase